MVPPFSENRRPDPRKLEKNRKSVVLDPKKPKTSDSGQKNRKLAIPVKKTENPSISRKSIDFQEFQEFPKIPSSERIPKIPSSERIPKIHLHREFQNRKSILRKNSRNRNPFSE
jgi:hypothetical protein